MEINISDEKCVKDIHCGSCFWLCPGGKRSKKLFMRLDLDEAIWYRFEHSEDKSLCVNVVTGIVIEIVDEAIVMPANIKVSIN